MFQIALTLRLVSEGKLRRYQKKTSGSARKGGLPLGSVLSWGKVCSADSEGICSIVRPGDALMECDVISRHGRFMGNLFNKT